MAGPTMAAGHELIDLYRYPIHDLDSDRGQELVATVQSDLREKSLAVLTGFLTADALQLLAAEAEQLVPLAYPGPTALTPYFFDYDIAGDDIDDDHPARMTSDRRLGQVAFDLIPVGSLLRNLYESDLVTELVRRVQQKDNLYRFGDKYQSFNVTVMEEGGCQHWHFDRGQLLTTLLLQEPDDGGVFEYAPDIRQDSGENFEAVADVMNGRSDHVRQLTIAAGSLTMFRGHYTLHRVTPVVGSRRRLQTVFSFADQPGVSGDLETSVTNYGPRVAGLEGIVETPQ